jgi:hypothetical protein
MDEEGADGVTLSAGGGGAGVGGEGGIGARHGGGWQLADGIGEGCGGQQMWRRQKGCRDRGPRGRRRSGGGDRAEVRRSGGGSAEGSRVWEDPDS